MTYLDGLYCMLSHSMMSSLEDLNTLVAQYIGISGIEVSQKVGEGETYLVHQIIDRLQCFVQPPPPQSWL